VTSPNSDPRTTLDTAATPAPHLHGPTVSTQWLADHLGSDGLVVLDASVLQVEGFGGSPAYVTGHEQYLVHGHVPGAVFADILEVFSDPASKYGFARPSAADFETAAAAVGVDDDTTVVVYDTSVGHWASRIWWLFRSFGHDNVAVLDGGLKKWVAEGRPTERGHVEPRVADAFTARERDGFWADKSQVQSIVDGDSDGVLVCGVPPREFSGEINHRARAGHIPGSLSAPAGRLVNRETNAFLPAEDLRSVFGDALNGRVIAYCGGGIAAAADALGLALLGHDEVSIYDGSLNEWAADPSAPLKVTV
jgi:Rhodanese-related sulfurtransferase